MALAVPPDEPGSVTTPAGASPSARRAVRTRVGVVIVNFCQWHNTARLVRQLRKSAVAKGGEAAIVVADNHSPAHRLADRLARLRGVQVLRSDRNDGFAAGVNRGVRRTAGDWLLLLNPDVTVPDGFLDDALAIADRADTQVGVIGFRLTDPDGGRQASCGPFPTLGSTLAGLLRPRASRKCRHLSADRPTAVDWATGGCLLVRRACFDALGGMDERFFLYYEDVDFCRRAVADGWTVLFDPRLAVVHHSPLHARRVPPALRLITRHALLTYARRYWPDWQSRLLARLVRLEATARRLTAALTGDRPATQSFRQLHQLTVTDDVEAIVSVKKVAKQLRGMAAAHDASK